MKKTIVALGLTMVCLAAGAQDRHFSQFYASPLVLNPALTGLVDGNYRAALSHRNQWASVLDEPFITNGVTFDGSFSPYRRNSVPDGFGAGMVFFSDRISQADFTNNLVAFSFAYHKALDMKGEQMLTAGYQLGIGQRSINPAGVSFGDQFNGITGYTFPTGEVFPINNITYADMAAGIYWTFKPSHKRMVYVGGAIHHFNRPDVSFYKPLGDPTLSHRLPVRYTAHAGYKMVINERTQVEPRALLMAQGGNLELNGGLNVRTLVNDYVDGYLHFGGWVRPVSDPATGNLVVDAVVLMAALQIQNFQVGASYDINVSNLSLATAGRGGFELSAIFIGNYENDSVICPTF